jgi:outer membrane lipopolysaccharide assembly protein LptE/RlpB
VNVVILVSALISSCGFQLRGISQNPSDLAFSELKLECPSTQSWQLCQSLRQHFKLNHIELNDAADYVLLVSPITQNSRVLSLQDNAAAAEYGLSSKLNYQLFRANEPEAISEQNIELTNSYRHESAALLSKERERSELQTELSQQLASEIFRQVTILNQQMGSQLSANQVSEVTPPAATREPNTARDD